MTRLAESSEDVRFKGVRRRRWGKWVSEIRLPNSRERIWLGSYDAPEKAARAFDAAAYCLRGRRAHLNFPENPPCISSPKSLTHQQIRLAAARHANAIPVGGAAAGTSAAESSSANSLTPLPEQPLPHSESDASDGLTPESEQGGLEPEPVDWSAVGFPDIDDLNYYHPIVQEPPPPDSDENGLSYNLWSF
ncbi:ethylene-responsive transcription factor ERF017-like [Dioscorea cayenensis subsp. rotundata]|uniref:Ethylene-responsive transcription factor ERF017-like n=1 Tax=Dioscorea cayennensis subsp. rotundata TaxID=55577 RepID=A0AB40AU22_DIOCR|nr:ethylene-responsive transcription factor ERF017-like [Dioscorea cayenensis subsp. rotundata]